MDGRKEYSSNVGEMPRASAASQVETAASGVAEVGSVGVVFDNAQFLTWYRERYPINAM